MTPRPILLDTAAILWATEANGLSPAAQEAIAEAERAGAPILASPISAWEIGMLVSRGRIALREDPKRWFDSLIAAGIALADLTPEIFMDSSFLPLSRLRDPADRILVATARVLDLRIMTRDRPILDYAAAGYVQAIAC